MIIQCKVKNKYSIRDGEFIGEGEIPGATLTGDEVGLGAAPYRLRKRLMSTTPCGSHHKVEPTKGPSRSLKINEAGLSVALCKSKRDIVRSTPHGSHKIVNFGRRRHPTNEAYKLGESTFFGQF